MDHPFKKIDSIVISLETKKQTSFNISKTKVFPSLEKNKILSKIQIKNQSVKNFLDTQFSQKGKGLIENFKTIVKQHLEKFGTKLVCTLLKNLIVKSCDDLF